MSTQYRVPVLEHFQWQQPVINMTTTTPPGAPTKGDRYVVAAGATGAWSGQDDDIAWWDGSAWLFDTPTDGFRLYNADDTKYWSFISTSWQLVGEGDMYKSVYDTNNNGIVDAAEALDDGVSGNYTTAAQVAAAVANSHIQNTDQYLDFGGANQISAAEAKEAYDRRGIFDTVLKVILFNLNP